jgi:cytochrome bd-type quinol oxidase subunit 2
LGGNVALFVLLVVGVVVGQTWLDWREARKNSPLPSWAKGTAMACVVAISLASVASYASVWMEGSGQSATGAESQAFWPEVGFLLCALAVIVAASRKKRLRWMFVLTGVIIAAFWVVVKLSA